MDSDVSGVATSGYRETGKPSRRASFRPCARAAKARTGTRRGSNRSRNRNPPSVRNHDKLRGPPSRRTTTPSVRSRVSGPVSSPPRPQTADDRRIEPCAQVREIHGLLPAETCPAGKGVADPETRRYLSGAAYVLRVGLRPVRSNRPSVLVTPGAKPFCPLESALQRHRVPRFSSSASRFAGAWRPLASSSAPSRGRSRRRDRCPPSSRP